MAFDNFFFDDQSDYKFNLEFETDAGSDSILGMNPDFSPFDGVNDPFDESFDTEDGEDWNNLHTYDEDFAEYLTDEPNECSLEPGAAKKLRKSRRTECEAEDPAKDLPSGFYDLSNDMQDQLYRRLFCPSKSPGESLIPVCSSRLPQNNHFDEQISNPGVWSYTLMDSFICMSVRDHVLFRI